MNSGLRHIITVLVLSFVCHISLCFNGNKAELNDVGKSAHVTRCVPCQTMSRQILPQLIIVPHVLDERILVSFDISDAPVINCSSFEIYAKTGDGVKIECTIKSDLPTSSTSFTYEDADDRSRRNVASDGRIQLIERVMFAIICVAPMFGFCGIHMLGLVAHVFVLCGTRVWFVWRACSRCVAG